MIDSAREVDLGLIDGFSQEIIGRNELLLSESAAEYLEIDGTRK
jgi:hypothetical protein